MNKAEKDAAYKEKQDWIESVMADTSLTSATKVYAFGVFKHMFGIRDESFPGAKAIKEATALNDGKYYKYNNWLEQAGYLKIDRKGKTGSGSNNYRLALPTPIGGNHLPPVEVDLPPVGVTPTPSGGTNTTRKPTMKTTKETNKAEPVVTSTLNNEVQEFTDSLISEPLTNPTNGVSQELDLPPVGVTPDLEGDDGPVSINSPNHPSAPWRHNGVLYQTKALAQAAREKDLVAAGGGW